MESTHCSSHGGLHSLTVKWFRRKTWSRQHFVLVRECWMVTRHQAPTFMQWRVLHLRGVLDAGAKYIVTRAGKRALVTDSTSFVCSSSTHRGCSIIKSTDLSKVLSVHIHSFLVVLHWTLGYLYFFKNIIPPL